MQALRSALRAAHSPYAGAAFEAMPDKGLAHLHLRLRDENGTAVIARIPKQSQVGLPPREHLAYEAACFERAAAGGHAPRLLAALAPSEELPHGALIVEAVHGRTAQLPADLGAIVRSMAALHALPLPAPAARPPLFDPADPLALLLREIDDQARHLDAARLAGAARERIEDERGRFRRLVQRRARPARRLIAFDAHPGNFLVTDDGKAMLVDLEKARYSHGALDLAHATLYTSTTWDLQSRAELGLDDVARASEDWMAALPDGEAERPWIVPLRRAMWLWSVSWCAKWRVLSAQAARGAGEDWSADLSDAALVRHVRDRVDCYLSPAIVHAVCDQADALAARLQR